ncbi:hypothetical protein GUJ93_ZPchr0009g1979 [Zizania palustris]|uniref:Uncharacterized protein n=1 Tax=Zizania palustris TaxID=103762 RepID=A0A8J5RKF8_ZIZPA|nr:hypothetical protein GUJ93_ZPchr0009g1979 [Zizania palustris]
MPCPGKLAPWEAYEKPGKEKKQKACCLPLFAVRKDSLYAPREKPCTAAKLLPLALQRYDCYAPVEGLHVRSPALGPCAHWTRALQSWPPAFAAGTRHHAGSAGDM